MVIRRSSSRSSRSSKFLNQVSSESSKYHHQGLSGSSKGVRRVRKLDKASHVITCCHFVMPKAATWQSCLSCCYKVLPSFKQEPRFLQFYKFQWLLIYQNFSSPSQAGLQSGIWDPMLGFGPVSQLDPSWKIQDYILWQHYSGKDFPVIK